MEEKEKESVDDIKTNETDNNCENSADDNKECDINSEDSAPKE